MTSQNQDRRECAFWIDAVDSALARWQQANVTGDGDGARRVFREMVSISGRAPQTTDDHVEQARRRVDEQLRTVGDPALLRSAFNHWPAAAEWESGDYASLIERAQQIPPEDSAAATP